MLTIPSLITAFLDLFTEAYPGPPDPSSTWFVDNEADAGVLGTIAALSAEEASVEHGAHRATIAAHTEHLRWSLALSNAFARGETPDADWAESWTVQAVDAAAWTRLQADLRAEWETLCAAIGAQPDLSDPNLLKGILALLPHAGYHLGVIRQMRDMLPR